MSIAPTLRHYLANRHVDYDLVAHQATASSLQTAGTCHIPPESLAKGVGAQTMVMCWSSCRHLTASFVPT